MAGRSRRRSTRRSIRRSTQFFDDLGQAYRKAVRAFADAGCRYLQLDEVFIAMLCDENYRQQMRERGDDPDKLRRALRRADQHRDVGHPVRHDHHHASVPRQLSSRPSWASGGYEPVQEILFNKIKVHGYFMEYDTARAGGFEPLRAVPKGKTVVLGLVTTKSGSARKQGRAQAPHRRGGEIRRHRPALPVAAMRLRLDRGGQYPGRGRAMGEAAHDRRSGRGGVGRSI